MPLGLDYAYLGRNGRWPLTFLLDVLAAIAWIPIFVILELGGSNEAWGGDGYTWIKTIVHGIQAAIPLFVVNLWTVLDVGILASGSD